MKSHQLFKITIALLSLVSTSHVLAQSKVVVIPMFDTKIVFTGVGKTGDVKCSEYKASPENWQEVSCASLPASLKGQDAELNVGAEVTPRFTTNGDGTVTDDLTGLIWLRDAFCVGQVLGDIWEDALGFIVELNTSGKMASNDCGDTSYNGTFQTDWRLPNVKELQSLLYYEHDMKADPFPFMSDTNGDGPYAAGDPFQKVRIDKAYWSSTNYGFQFDADLNVNLIDDALAVNFGDAVTDGKGKNGMQHVWAVRAGN
jgi:hypothetical protein